MMDLIFWFFLGFAVFLAWRVTEAAKDMANAEKIIVQALHEKFIVMKIEENEDGIFAYRFRNGEFLAYGNTFEKMAENFRARFPGKTGLVANRDGSQQELK